MTGKLKSSNTLAEFNVTFPKNSWIGIGFGAAMKSTPMFVLYTEQETDKCPLVHDLYSTDTKRPDTNAENKFTVS